MSSGGGNGGGSGGGGGGSGDGAVPSPCAPVLFVVAREKLQNARGVGETVASALFNALLGLAGGRAAALHLAHPQVRDAGLCVDLDQLRSGAGGEGGAADDEQDEAEDVGV